MSRLEADNKRIRSKLASAQRKLERCESASKTEVTAAKERESRIMERLSSMSKHSETLTSQLTIAVENMGQLEERLAQEKQRTESARLDATRETERAEALQRLVSVLQNKTSLSGARRAELSSQFPLGLVLAVQQLVVAVRHRRKLFGTVISSVQSLFSTMDRDGDGVLSIDEIETALHRLDIDVDVSDMVRHMSSDGSSTVSIQDFMQALQEALADTKLASVPDASESASSLRAASAALGRTIRSPQHWSPSIRSSPSSRPTDSAVKGRPKTASDSDDQRPRWKS